MSLTLDSLRDRVGQTIGTSPWLEITQDMIDAFANTTGDRQWIHIDPERARLELPGGRTIAHGFLTLALVSRFHFQAVPLTGLARTINYGLGRVRFPAPVPAGSSLRGHSTLKAFDLKDDAVQLTWEITVEISGQTKPALVAEWLLRHYPTLEPRL